MKKKYARKYDKRVTIQTVGLVSDGFGGQVPSGATTLESRWCKVEPPKQIAATQYKNDFGLKGDARILRFCFRAFDFDIKKHILFWKGTTFNPLVVEDADQYDVETVIVAQAVEDNL